MVTTNPTRIAEQMAPSHATIHERRTEFRLADVHTCMPAQVTQYNPARNTVDVTPCLQTVVRNADGTESVEAPPNLVEVPVLFPRGGGYYVAWPLEPGDTVLLVFAERSIDDWSISGGTGVRPEPPRKHDWADAIAIPGVAPALQAIAGLNATDMFIGQESGLARIQIEGATGTIVVNAEAIDLGGAGGSFVARVGDQVEIDAFDPKNTAFAAWIAAV